MPKISAPTVKEHREAVLAKLVDAAEAILREQGASQLTASAVTAQAGIARNSIYRYVESVDDLSGLVVARYLPRWLRAVREQVDAVTEPRARIETWVRVNLEQASANGHGWLMNVARNARIDSKTRAHLDSAHDEADALAAALADLHVREQQIVDAMIRSVTDAGFRSLDAGASLPAVTDAALVATRALVDAATA